MKSRTQTEVRVSYFCNRHVGIRVILFLSILFPVCVYSETVETNLWYSTPAKNWEKEALPLGNGRIGCMVFGGVERERIQFNEDSLWTGDENPSGVYETMGAYQAFGDLFISMDISDGSQASFENYRRELLLSDGIFRVEFRKNGVQHERTVFASWPDQVIVVRWRADKPGSISGTVELKGMHKETTTTEGNTLSFGGKLPNGMQYQARVEVLVKGGALEAREATICLKKCDEVVLLLAAATDYVMDASRKYHGEDPVTKVREQIETAAGKPFEELKERHVGDHRKLFGRVQLNLGDTAADVRALPTDQRLAAYAKGGVDPELEALLFQYGRYLLMGSSRRPGLPANLQGLWNESNTPPWSSDYHVNINVQMNYWPAEVTNLAECHLPLFDLISSQLEPWRKATQAEKQFQLDGKPVRGWALRTSHNITGGLGWQWDKTANAWYCLHMWEHYAFTQDKKFLRTVAYPILKEICEFWEDHLKTLSDGRLVVPNGWSPEHGPHEDGVSYNQQIVFDLFSNFVEAADALGVDREYRNAIAAMRDKLVAPQIGKWGQLQEWMTDRDEPKDEHRHTSHLFAAYPGRQISVTRTPELAKAAAVSLEARGTAGDSRRSWTWPWRCALWARLGNAEKAYEMVRGLFAYNMLPNLYATHPPFQLDGNFGYTAGVAEMLLQSHAGEIHLLPALPSAWKIGSVKGLCARGGFAVDMDWKDGRLTKAVIHSTTGTNSQIRYGNTVGTVSLKPGQSVTLNEQLVSQIAIIEVKPTVFYVKDGESLQQMAEVVIDNPGPVATISLETKVGNQSGEAISEKISSARNSVWIRVPEGVEGKPVVVVLTAGHETIRRETIWPKQRHWEVCLVPITHHDLGYTDTIEHVMRSFDGFYDNIIRFCEDTSDWPDEAKYRYTVEAGWSLQHYLENRPKETIDKLARFVAEGRIEIGALFGNQISCLSGHEEGIRLMYPSFRMQQRLGGQIQCGSITDVPGLSWSLPTVLAGAGVKYFFAGCPTYFEWGRNDIHTFWDENAILRYGRPDAFWWEGPDGKKVLVYYQSSYGFFHDVVGPSSYDEVYTRLPTMLEGLDRQGCPFDTLRYIHNGVDNCPPDMQISRIVREWNAKWAYPRLVVATNAMFFDKLEKQCKDIRTFRGELPDTDYVVGAISTARETTVNRTTHSRLAAAEKLATVASLLGREYPAEAIRSAYDNMILYDEHTWGKAYPAGPEQDWAWHEKSLYALRAAGLADMTLNRSAETIAQEVKRTEGGRHIVVLNPLAIARTDVVRVAKFTAPKAFELVDVSTGAKVPYQLTSLAGPLTPSAYSAYRFARGSYEVHEMTDLIFVAEDVPSLGCRTYRIVETGKSPVFETQLKAEGTTLENDFFRVEMDAQRGGIKSVFDKILQRELVDAVADAAFNQIIIKSVPTGNLTGPGQIQVRPAVNGTIVAGITSTASAPGCPQVIQEVTLYNKIKRVDLANRVLKDSSPLMEVYFAFPFAVDKPQFRYEGTDSVIEPLKDQFPGSNSNYYAVQHWADVSDGKIGVILSAAESHLMEFGGLWPCYVSQAHHGLTPPKFGQPFTTAEQLSKGHIYAFVMDSNFRTNFQPVQQGDILFRYSLTSHKGDWTKGGCRDFGWSFANPLIAVQVEGKKDGRIEPTEGFCSVEPANVFLMTVKQAEDGRGLILRLIETEGKPATAVVQLPQVRIRQCSRTNLVEQRDREVPFEPHAVRAEVGPFGIETLRIEINP